jgi:hypothetical protein
VHHSPLSGPVILPSGRLRSCRLRVLVVVEHLERRERAALTAHLRCLIPTDRHRPIDQAAGDCFSRRTAVPAYNKT